MSRFETEMLSSMKNLTALMDLSGTWVDSPVATLLHEKMDGLGAQEQTFVVSMVLRF